MSQSTVVDSLKQLITALDARHVQTGRPEEAGIAKDALELRDKAVSRLAELDADPDAPDA